MVIRFLEVRGDFKGIFLQVYVIFSAPESSAIMSTTFPSTEDSSISFFLGLFGEITVSGSPQSFQLPQLISQAVALEADEKLRCF